MHPFPQSSQPGGPTASESHESLKTVVERAPQGHPRRVSEGGFTVDERMRYADAGSPLAAVTVYEISSVDDSITVDDPPKMLSVVPLMYDSYTWGQRHERESTRRRKQS